jgi:hypothetical protein
LVADFTADFTPDFLGFDLRWAVVLRRADEERDVIWFEPVYALST